MTQKDINSLLQPANDYLPLKRGIVVGSSDKTLGQIGYEAYCASTGGKSLISGAELPAYDQLVDAIKHAWQAAGDAMYGVALVHWEQGGKV